MGKIKYQPLIVFSVLILGAVFAFMNTRNVVQAQSTVLSISPITWNIVGLDSNSPATGPHQFPVGAEVCNIGGAPINNIDVTFTWTSVNGFINLLGGVPTQTLNIATLAAGTCSDAYFQIDVTQTAAAFDTSRRYVITATAGAETVFTPQPREIYVEHLISQNRNATLNVTYGSVGSNCNALQSVAPGGSMNLVVGQSYRICLYGSTATQGYEQLESFLTLPNTIFQILGVETDYTANTSGNVNTSNHPQLYADACFWENDPNSPNYLACNVSSLKSGGGVVTAYDVTILSGGGTQQTLNSLLYDFSGSSFHYNSDFSTGFRYATIIDPASATIAKRFSPTAMGVGGVSTLIITLANPNGGTLSGYNFVDNLPGDMVVATPLTFSTNGCGTPTFAPTVGSNILNFSNGTVAGNSTCTISVSVTASSVQTYTNTTNNLFVGSTDTGNSATADLTVTNAPLPPACTAGLPLATWTFATAGSATAPAPATSTVTATASAGAGLVPILGNDRVGTAGSSSWESDAIDSTGTLTLANNEYFQFVLNTSGVVEVNISYWAQRTPQGPQSARLHWGVAGTENIATVDTITGSWVNFARTITTGLNTTGNTVFRLYVYNAGNSSSGHAIRIDDVVFTGCSIPNHPTITKAFSPNPIGAGGVSTLTFTLTNPNTTIALTGASFNDTLPTGMTVAPAPTAATTCGGTWAPVAGAGTLTFSGGTIPAGGSCTVRVDVTSSVAGPSTNISGLISTTQTGQNGGAGGSANATLTVLSPPQIDKQFSPNPIVENGVSTLSFSITNPNSNNTINGVAFADNLPAGMVIAPTPNVTSTCGGTLTATSGTGVITLAGGTITASNSCTITVAVTVATSGSYINTTSNVSHIVNVQTFSGNTATDTLDAVPPTPGIANLKQVGTSPTGPWFSYIAVAPATDVYYLITVENIGDAPLNPITVNDPNVNTAGCVWTSPLPVADAFDDDHIDTCVIGPVSAVAGTNPNTATATGTYSATPYTDSSTATYATAELSMVKVANPLTFTTAGQVINYTFTVENTGTSTLSGPVTITDDQSTDEACPALTTVGDNDNFFDPGEIIVCTATYTVTPTDVLNGSVTNIAFASAGGFNSPTDTETVSTPNANLSLVKTVTTTPIIIGDPIQYTLTLTNSGPNTATNVNVNDVVPASITVGVVTA